MFRAPTPPTAVNFFFEGMSPVLLDGILLKSSIYIMQILIMNINYDGT
jgi:hypothetical protein